MNQLVFLVSNRHGRCIIFRKTGGRLCNFSHSPTSHFPTPHFLTFHVTLWKVRKKESERWKSGKGGSMKVGRFPISHISRYTVESGEKGKWEGGKRGSMKVGRWERGKY